MICSDLTVKIGHLDSSPSNGHQGDMPYFGWFWNVDSIAVIDEFIPGLGLKIWSLKLKYCEIMHLLDMRYFFL